MEPWVAYYLKGGYYKIPLVMALGCHYVMRAHVCYKCLESYSEPAPKEPTATPAEGTKKANKGKSKGGAAKKEE